MNIETARLIENALKLSADTKALEVGASNLHRVPVLFKEYFPGRNALIVADSNTWNAAGREVERHMKDAGIPCSVYLFPWEEFHAEYEYSSLIEDEMEKDDSIVVSVGAGVINDLCKLASFNRGRQYFCVATAASVDGYASSGAVCTKDGAKVNLETHAPVVIVADTEVLAKAPKRLTAAGYGDLASKIPAGAEWMIADLFGTEPIIPEAWHMVMDVLDMMLGNPQGVAEGDPEAISLLFAGLTLSGIAMQAAKSSRPASCSEHLFSHYLDMTEYRFEGKLQSHGDQVAIGTITMCAFFDELLKMDLTEVDVDACVEAWPTLEQEQERAKEIFKDFPVPMLGYTEITRKYNDKETVRKQLTKIKETWPEFSKRIRRQVYSFEKMQDMCRMAGAPYAPEHIGVSREMLRNMVDYVQLMRWRINMFDLAKRAGIYDVLIERVFGKGGVLETA